LSGLSVGVTRMWETGSNILWADTNSHQRATGILTRAVFVVTDIAVQYLEC